MIDLLAKLMATFLLLDALFAVLRHSGVEFPASIAFLVELTLAWSLSFYLTSRSRMPRWQEAYFLMPARPRVLLSGFAIGVVLSLAVPTLLT